MDENHPKYFVTIPAEVRFDYRLSANAKLVYGEIASLVGVDGYCFATNGYFCKHFGFSATTVTRLISELVEYGYVNRDLVRDDTGKVVRRKLYPGIPVPDSQPSINNGTTHQKKEEGTFKNDGYTNTRYTNNIPPIIPPVGEVSAKGVRHRFQRCKDHADILPDRFEGFWDYYRTHIPEGVNAGSRQKAIRAWDRLAPDDCLASAMAASLARQVKSQVWQSGVGVPHASTWLRNRGWEDDWGAPAQIPVASEGRHEEWL